MDGLSKKEIEIISWLEFYKKYFFTSADVDKFTSDKTQRYNIIKNLLKKKRIIKLNKTKYYLIPIKAKSGSWSEDTFILTDEIMNGTDYQIAGWAAANYWRLTDQIPMQIDVYTTKKQGKMSLLNTKIIFHRTTKKRLKNSCAQKISGHTFQIQTKEASKEWMKSRN